MDIFKHEVLTLVMNGEASLTLSRLFRCHKHALRLRCLPAERCELADGNIMTDNIYLHLPSWRLASVAMRRYCPQKDT